MPALNRIVPIVILASVTLAGCASTSAQARPGETPTTTQTTVTVTNCGTKLSFDSAPQRVVTIKSSTTEMLLALGVGNRIVGTAFQDGPVPEEWAGDATGIPSLSDRVPSEEVVLDAEPDLVYAGWESNFSPDGAGQRDELAELGVATYVAPAACQSSGQPPRLRFDDIFAEIREVASIFRVDSTQLIGHQRATLAALTPDGAGRTAFWYSSGSDTPYAGAGIGAPQLILDTVGLTNIAADVKAAWAPYNWESVVDADPDFIVLVDSTWSSAEKKISVLEANPATAALPAVQNHRYLVVPFAASEAGVRTAQAASSISDQIAKLGG